MLRSIALPTIIYLITTQATIPATQGTNAITAERFTPVLDTKSISNNVYSLWMIPTRTTLACAVKCAQKNDCIGFIVWKDSQLCQGITVNTTYPAYVHAESDLVYVTTNKCKLGNGGCQQGCVNNNGTMQCKCGVGYTLNVDGQTCDVACDSGWRSFYGLCYWFEKSSLISWKYARDQCARLGAQLASVKTLEVKRFIIKTGTWSAGTDMWLGGTDLWSAGTDMWLGGNDLTTEGDWRWLDGTEVAPAFGGVSNWHSNEPSNGGKSEHCLIMGAGGKWNDGTCNTFEDKQYVCVKR